MSRHENQEDKDMTKMKRRPFGLKEFMVVASLCALAIASPAAAGLSLRLSTDRMFYSTQPQLKATVRVGLDDGSLRGLSLSLVTRGPDGETLRTDEVDDLLLLSTTDVDIGALPEGRYTLAAVLKDAAGKQVAEDSSVFHRIKALDGKIPRLRLTAAGVPVLDGKPALLSVVWLGGEWEGPIEKEELKAIAAQGFDAVVVGEVYMREEALAHYAKYPDKGGGGKRQVVERSKFRDFKQFLEALHEYNLPCFAHMGEISARFPELQPANLEDSADFILKYREDPAILGWYSLDETDGWIETNRKVYGVIKEVDPDRPVWLNVIGAVGPNRDACDILSTDPYPVGHSLNLKSVAGALDNIVKAQKGLAGKSPWVILQMFGSPWEGWPRPPTPKEERCMAYLALNHGAKSLGYFAHQRLRDLPTSQRLTPELWDSMRSLNAETKEMALPYLLGERLSGITCQPQSLDIATMRHQGSSVLVAVNPTEKEVDATFAVGSLGRDGAVPVKFEARTAPVKDGVLSDHFLPYDVHIYLFPQH